MNTTSVREASEADAEAIAAIYAHHVLHGTATFDVDPPSPEQLLAKIRAVQQAGWPFLVAERDDEVVGYAYATQFRDRPAYRFACEDSIYVHPAAVRKGVGRALILALVQRASECGFTTMIAVVGGGEPASVALHAACGFREVGRLRSVGWKQERWLDSVYMQRDLPAVS